jgi:hypothetical protein
MERMIRIASPFLFLAISVWLFVDTGFFATPGNDTLSDLLSVTTRGLEAALERGALPSVQAREALQEREAALAEIKQGIGTAGSGSGGPGSGDETLESVLKEWGYQAEDPIALALKTLESQLRRMKGPAWSGDRSVEVRTFVNDLARKMGDADLFTSLTLAVVPDSAPNRAPLPGSLVGFRLEFSFISGVDEAVQFLEDWALDTPPGIFVTPEKIMLRRIEPNLWGSSLRYYSGPPIRADLTVAVLFNVTSP